ncbi:hypothetical protein ES695_14805 [Candidatus Atribacteria bacterium 1244-E10-H5-B2]|nr:MAG: hypothetical protein ES695_14805 [Candidatus Atribacteria bacterium 1244-E10-H5-B2]
MSKVKIGDKEYTINHLKLGTIKKILKAKEEKKLDNMDATSYILAETINKFNPDAKMSIEKFDETVDIVEFERVQKEIMDNSGLTKYFNMGVGKK